MTSEMIIRSITFDRLRNLNYLRISLVCKTVQAIALAIPS
jgi:hypothetical protein